MRKSRAEFLRSVEKARTKPWTLISPDGSKRRVGPVHPKDLPSLFDDIRLVPAGHKHPWFPRGDFKVPRLCWTPALRFKKSTYTNCSLLTLTSKLRAPSYGLCAGPPSLGGTCTISGKPSRTGYVCHNCYATTGNYGNPNVNLYTTVRKLWTRKMVRNGRFAEIMSATIGGFSRVPRVDANGNYCSFDFFRIHDTGDVDWLPGYYDAWIDVAERQHQVRFWMPTRAWAAKSSHVLEADRPNNLTVRPSPLYLDSPAPSISYLDGGTSVAFFDKWEECAEWDCPAVRNHSNCESEEGPNGQKPCRACWLYPELTINYRPHGEATRKIRRYMKNPQESLDELYDAYMSGQRSNPPATNFAEYLSQSGRKLSDWDLESWEAFLRGQGLDEEEIGDWLEETAEYD